MDNLWGDQEKLSAKEIALRNEFVRQYLLDYDEVLACMRLGFTKPFALEYSAKFMLDPYVQQQISINKLKSADDEQDQEEADKSLVLSVLREAAQKGPFASRVAAASKLAAICGMDKPSAVSLDISNRGGVMVVPGIGNIDDWEAEATKSQEELIRTSKEGI